MSSLLTYDPSRPSRGKIKPFYSQNRRHGAGGGFGAFLSTLGKFTKPLIKKILSGTATELMKKRARRFGQSAFNEAANALSSYAMDRMNIHPLSSSKRGAPVGRRGRVMGGRGNESRKAGGAYVDDAYNDDNEDDDGRDDDSRAASGQEEDLLNHSSQQQRLGGDFGVKSVLPIDRLLSVKNKRRRSTVKKKKKKRAISRKKKSRARITKKKTKSKKKSKRTFKKSKKIKGGASGGKTKKNKKSQKIKGQRASIFD